MNKTAIVVGAGIVGLATARALALKGYSVTVLEKDVQAVGASIRNFGMIWPIGQPEGVLLNRAMRSREIWSSILQDAAIWHNPCGSMHLAYNELEWQVLQELFEQFSKQERNVSLLSKQQLIEKYPEVNTTNLYGGLFSDSELIVNPLLSIATLPAYFSEKYAIQFLWAHSIQNVTSNTVYYNDVELKADLVFVCSGANFQQLFPTLFKELPITKCKLQMLKMKSVSNKKLNTSLCGGLSLIHYKSFEVAASLPKLKNYYELTHPEYLKWGIHVMVDQNNQNEFIIGDSHEYGHTHLPFNRYEINQLILKYLHQFLSIDDLELLEQWNGIYPKMTNGATEVFLNPLPGVYIINGLGGAGMTLSFGLAEEVVNSL
jgi:FAD dependent oxidoreductase TIGR03364